MQYNLVFVKWWCRGDLWLAEQLQQSCVYFPLLPSLPFPSSPPSFPPLSSFQPLPLTPLPSPSSFLWLGRLGEHLSSLGVSRHSQGAKRFLVCIQ